MTEPSAGPSEQDLQALSRYGSQLADGIEAAIGPWVVRSVDHVVTVSTGRRPSAELLEQAVEAGRAATEAIVPDVRALLALDIDDQHSNPLAIVRGAVAWPTAVLRGAGISPVDRDEAARSMFPDDEYDLSPVNFAALDPDLHEPGLIWGAAKAHVHLARRRAAGQR